MTEQINKQWVGFIFGLIGPVIGAVLFYFAKFSHMRMFDFFEEVFVRNISSEFISVSSVFNLLVFFIFIWTNLQKAARGVILATFVYVLIVVMLKAL